MTLLNWDPSKGDPAEWSGLTKFVLPEIARCDVLPSRRKRHAEKVLIEDTLAGLEPAGEEPGPEWHVMEIPPRHEKQLVGNWDTWYQVADVATLNAGQAHRLLHCWERRNRGRHEQWWAHKPRTLKVDINYPLDTFVRIEVPPLKVQSALPTDRQVMVKEVMSPGWLMWAVAKEYERIYANWKHYGVWGHSIDDLGFERIKVDEDGVATLYVGS